MTIINQKSISGITSITTAAAGDNLLTVHTNDGTERLRIDSSGNTRITAGIVTTLTVTGNGTVGGTLGVTGDVDIADKIVHTGDTNTAIRFPAADTVTVETGGSEAIRVDSSQRLMVGTTSGTYKTEIVDDSEANLAIRTYNNGAQNFAGIRLYKARGTEASPTVVSDDDTLNEINIYGHDGSTFRRAARIAALVDGTPGSDDMPGRLTFSTTADGSSTPTERLRIDSSGQVILNNGAGSSDATILRITGGTSGSSVIEMGDTADTDIGQIAYYQSSNAMAFRVNASEALRIDSNGRLLVNHSADVAPDGFESLIQTSGTDYRGGSISIRRDENSSSGPALLFTKTRSGSIGGNTLVNSGDALGTIWFYGADGNDVNQAGAKIECNIDAASGSNDMPGRLSFYVTSDGAASPVERMRINRKGFLKMGPRITDGSQGVADLDSVRHEFTSDNNGWVLYVQHTSGSASESEGILIAYRTTSPNGTGNSFIQGNDSNATRFRFASNGGLYNYSGNNSNLSDEREKKNIVSLDNKWDKVKSWELKKFHYNEDADSDDLRYGVIAQQVEEHCPEVVSDWVKKKAESAVLDEDGNVVTPAQAEVVRKGVKEQQMMWMAIKALQEAQTRIETLETQNTAQQTQINDLITRVTALEG